jgi:hypothetical protein
VTTCPTGIHDKQVEPDEVDPVGHNVDAALGVDPAYDLAARLAVLQPPDESAVAPGTAVVLRASAANTGPATGLPGWRLTVVLPADSHPVVPRKHALRTCTSGSSSAGYPTVTCTGTGPLSPGVTSIAMDVTLSVPTGSAPLRAIAYVTPVTGQGAETVPAGPVPSQPSVDAGSTPTDNDASVVLPVTAP